MRLNIQGLVDKKFAHTTGKFAGQANISQFAKAIGIERIAALKIYNGETSSINFDILESICCVLDCTPNDIIVSEDPTVRRLLAYYKALNKDDSK
ncbi:helix-turn-helix domain-containing protein [Lacrimispora sp.]|uniref:helix-turn-helix domain-containing protein n=1 Tax=Lacrimispora sp. TaxID=2719234 RepID=UPI0028B1CB4B|nr:helix-turn-helix transcriptional regulator [Lacrimispora sp.]